MMRFALEGDRLNVTLVEGENKTYSIIGLVSKKCLRRGVLEQRLCLAEV